MDKEKRTVFLTGATGTMGRCALDEMLKRDRLKVRVLARPSAKNHRFLDALVKEGKVEVVWGDLTKYEDVERGVRGADYVLHVGGLVSPLADRFPEKTMKVNTTSAANIVRAVKSQPDAESIKVVYIGSVAQYGNRPSPHHWGRTGDPVWGSKFDWYALSKIAGERIIAEGGLARWVSLRQTGILADNLIAKGSDPITFHVPLDGVLEWTTDRESGVLLANLCDFDLPDDFWNRFYNIGNGGSFRMTNYEFERMILKAMYCPPPEKIFEPGWFATRNFHGLWYTDSDDLQAYLHFRSPQSSADYFHDFSRALPFFFRFTKAVPSSLIKSAMKMVASKKGLGTLYWKKHGVEDRLSAYFGAPENRKSPAGWKDYAPLRPSMKALKLDHGYDESKPDSELDIEDMRCAARFRGGECLSGSMVKGDLTTPLEWRCHDGHVFHASPRLILKGGHWCDRCFDDKWRYEEIAKHNPFFAQVYKPE